MASPKRTREGDPTGSTPKPLEPSFSDSQARQYRERFDDFALEGQGERVEG
jgi:hypothetical protein